MTSALNGVLVLELCEVFQGPLAGQILGDFGADVVKIERPPRGDSLRRSDTVANGKGLMGSFFAAANRNKRAIQLDLKSDEGRESLFALIRSADVLLHNYRPGVMEKLGLGYDDLKKVNSRLVYAAASGFGETGPYARMAGQDLLIQSMSGLAMKTTNPSGEPTFLNVPLTDFASGVLLAQGVLLALLERSQSGQGQKVTVSLLNAAIAMQSLEAATILNFDYETRWFDRTLNFTLEVKDGWITVLGFFRDNPLRLICESLGLPDLSVELGIEDGPSQARRKAEIVPRLQPALAALTVAEAVDLLQRGGVLAAPIHTLQTALQLPQIQENGLITEVPVEGQAPMRVIANPIGLSRTPASVRLGPPAFGAHDNLISQLLHARAESAPANDEMVPRRLAPSAYDLKSWTVPQLLADRAALHPDRPFVEILGGAAQTVCEVQRDAQKIARGLRRLGVQPAESVLIMLSTSLEALHAWFGVCMIGAIDASINTGYRGSTLVHAINVSGAAVLIVSGKYLAEVAAVGGQMPALTTIIVVGDRSPGVSMPPGMRVLNRQDLDDSADGEPFPEVLASDIASLMYTSGTTGPAKGALMPHGQVSLIARLTAVKTGLQESDVFYCYYPLYHMAGKFMSVLAVLAAGARIVLDTNFCADEWLARIRLAGATVTAAHGPILEMVFAVPASSQDTDHRLRTIRAAPLPRRIAAEFQTRFGVKTMEVWGMTELGIPCWGDEREVLRPGASGQVDRDWFELQIVDPSTDELLRAGSVGELVVRSRHPWTLMQGYIGMPEATAKAWRNLWFHTGDLGFVDEDGYVHFVERAAERIRRKGENISACDIELVALQHDDVTDAVALGVPSDFEGDEEVKLVVVHRAGTSLTPESLLRFLANRLPHFMVPRYIEFLDSLPRSVTGKIQRGELKVGHGATSVWDRKAAGIDLRLLIQASRSESS